ncbi:MAG: type II secretion system protein [Candidatus Paceibacterota bacterium]
MAIINKQAGFTLIEMLVVVGIFAVVATTLLFNYSSFSTSVGVRNLSEQIGISIRKAQSYATSVRSISGSGGLMSDTFPAYGIAFSEGYPSQNLYDPTDSSFTLFTDVSPQNNTITNNIFDNNGSCGAPGQDQECVENFSITNGNKIVSLCTDSPSAGTCFTAEHPGKVNIVFHRPNPDAIICIVDQSGNCSSQLSSYVKITVQSLKGINRIITIWSTGQISVN